MSTQFHWYLIYTVQFIKRKPSSLAPPEIREIHLKATNEEGAKTEAIAHWEQLKEKVNGRVYSPYIIARSDKISLPPN